jgi:acetylornithine/N-succinyldiaminopimelate aminotransferase
VLDTIADQDLLESVKRVGEHLAEAITALDSPLIAGVRGSGLWRGIRLSGDHAGSIEVAARRHGLLVNAVKTDTLRLAPPLVVTEAEVDEAIALLAAALADVEAALGVTV